MFQPHGFGPIAKMGEQLAQSFVERMAPEDRLYLPDPVYQGGTVDKSRGSDWLAAEVGAAGRRAEHVPDRAALGERLVGDARPGDRIVIMGARDDSLSEFAADLVDRIGSRN
jgi:UDP-N-acetylmuramate--alanine ligase